MKANRRILVPILAVAVLAAAGGTLWYRFGARSHSAGLTLYGNVDIREVELAFRVPGRLTKMQFDEGDAVEQGQLVAEIDPVPYREALAAADARVQQAEANVAKMKAGTRPQQVQQAQAAVRAAEADFADAQSDYKRQAGLFESGASSEKLRNAARARRDAAAAKLASAREALALAKAGFRSEDIAAAEADLAAAKAQRAQAQTRLDDTRLTAPADGILLSRVREPGSILSAGAPVYSLSLRNPIYVRAYVNERDLGKLAPGTAVTVDTDSSTKAYHGQIGFISPRAEFTPKSVQSTDLRTDLVYRLRIVVGDADEGLRQGMPVTVHVPLPAQAQ
jgi:HlyD family secretion protein